jgi:hypothetical protein
MVGVTARNAALSFSQTYAPPNPQENGHRLGEFNRLGPPLRCGLPYVRLLPDQPLPQDRCLQAN